MGNKSKEFHKTAIDTIRSNVKNILEGKSYGISFEVTGALGLGGVFGGMFVVDKKGSSSYFFLGGSGGLSIGVSGTIGVVEYLGARDGLAQWGGAVNVSGALGLIGGEAEFIFAGGNSGGYLGWAGGGIFSLAAEVTYSWLLTDQDF